MSIIPKLQPYVLGSGSEYTSTEEAQQLNTFFGVQQWINRSRKTTIDNKDNIYTLEGLDGWIIKEGRTDLQTTPDTHLYRIRKAEKLRRLCRSFGFANEVEIPRKYIHIRPNGQAVVVAQKLDLSDRVVRIDRETADACLPQLQSGSRERSIISRANNGDDEKTVALTTRQCQILATLAFSNAEFHDISFANLFLTKTGKLALVDTEPVKRAWKKNNLGNRLAKLFFTSKTAIAVIQGLIATAKLKTFAATTEEAKKAITKIENKNIVIAIAKIVTKIAVVAFVAYACMAFIPAGFLFAAIKYTVVAMSGVNILTTAINILAILNITRLNRKGIEGLGYLSGLEANGFF